MRRGPHAFSDTKPADGWTKQELLDAVVGGATLEEESGSRRGGLSPKTFDIVRKAARVRGPSHGGLSWVFSPEEVAAMVRCAEGGRFTERGGPIAAAWRALLVERGFPIEEPKKLRGRRDQSHNPRGN